MLEKNLLNYLSPYIKNTKLLNVKKGDIVQIQMQISTNRKQTFTGICVRNKKNGTASTIVIQYKLSGQTITHSFPTNTKKIISITKI